MLPVFCMYICISLFFSLYSLFLSLSISPLTYSLLLSLYLSIAWIPLPPFLSLSFLFTFSSLYPPVSISIFLSMYSVYYLQYRVYFYITHHCFVLFLRLVRFLLIFASNMFLHKSKSILDSLNKWHDVFSKTSQNSYLEAI